jgi:hypothetical protein
MPGNFLAGFTRQLLDRRQQLLRDGHPPEGARELAVAEAVEAFQAGASARGWTVERPRITSLAQDTLGLEEEYRDRHGHQPELARLATIAEVLEAERVRGEVPEPWWREEPERGQEGGGRER